MSLDAIVIGAGPAGMSAALSARALGMQVGVLDAQESPGGQIYRNVLDADQDQVLGGDYSAGRQLVQEFLSSDVGYYPGTRVWRIDQEGVYASGRGNSFRLKGRHVILAAGAMERPVPTEGWTLPGVMTAGAAQVLLKSSGVVADDAVFIGSGPLMLLVVAQYLRAGVKVRAVLDTTPRSNFFKAIPHAFGALVGMHYLVKGLGLQKEIRSLGTRIEHISSYRILGESKVEALEYQVGNRTRRVECKNIFLHQGVIPMANDSMSTGCKHRWNDQQLGWQPDVDGFGRSSLDWLRIAGDCSGISGAVSAEYSGKLATLGVARDQGRISEKDFQRMSSVELRRLKRDRSVRPFLDAYFRPSDEYLRPTASDTTVCRCEMVSKEQIERAVEDGAVGPNQVKVFTRAGMGPCQGRICGSVVPQVISEISGKSVSEVGHLHIRSPFNPVTLGELSDLKIDGP